MVAIAELSCDLAEAPNCRRFLEAWQDWRGDKLLPDRKDVRPERLGPALEGVSILEYRGPDELNYHLASTLLNELLGRDRTGDNYALGPDPELAALRLHRHNLIRQTPCGMVALVDLKLPSGRVISLTTLTLPVRADCADQYDRAYVAADSHGARDWHDVQSIAVLPIAHQVIAVDIGAGEPDAALINTVPAIGT